MSRLDIRDVALELLEDASLREEIEAVRVAALLRSLGRDSSSTSFNLRRVQRNLVAINRAARRQVRTPRADIDLAQLAIFLARSYEQLIGLDAAADVGVRMASAVNYELAGFQANAATLARQAVNIRALNTDQRPTIEQLASLFLQRRFLRCSRLGTLAPDAASSSDNVDLDAGAVLQIATDVSIQGVASAASALINGDIGLFATAGEDLSIARDALLDVGFATQTSVLEGLVTLLPGLASRSVWTRLGPHLPESRLWRRYLSALGRGLAGENPLDLRSISELWPSQEAAVANNILTSGGRVVRMPTSAGKTRVAEMFILSAIARRPGAKALYIAPFNALTSEVTASFNDLFVDLGLSLSSLTGTYDKSPLEADVEDDDLLIVTPEKMDQLLRSNSEFLDHVDAVVLDEGHVVGEANRGPKYELAVSRLRRRRPDADFLALSAVVPDETLRDFSTWLKATDEPISTPWRPTQTRLAMLEWDGSEGDLVYIGEGMGDGLRVRSVITSTKLEYRSPETGRLRRPLFPEATHRAQVAAAMAWQVVDRGPVLIYCATPPYAQAVASALGTRLEIARHREETIPTGLAAIEPRSVAVAEEWLGPNHKITQLLRAGVGVHYSALPEAVRTAIEDDFRGRRLTCLAATPTLAQGVNLPVRTLVVHSTRRYDEFEEAQVRLPARDFWNVAGRVGRAGHETEGTVVFLCANAMDRSDLAYYVEASRAGVEPVESALMKMLKNLLQQRISSNEIASQLDSDMLALLVEEGSAAQSTDGLQTIVGDSLFQVQAHREQQPAERMWHVMATTAGRIAGEVPDDALRAVFASTGLSSPSCRAIQRHIQANELRLRQLAAAPTTDAADRSLILEGLTQCAEMAPRNLDIGHSDVLEGWLEGASVSDLAGEYDVDALQLTSFIEDFFGYKLPWGISGYLQVAAHLLAWETMPDHLASLPLLVRYGVPNVQAAWLMSLGSPSRTVALRLADRFVESKRPQSMRSLRRWLSDLNIEDVSKEFGSLPGRLEAATRMILRASGNPHLRRYYAGEEMLPLVVRQTVRFRDDDRAEYFEEYLSTESPTVHVQRDYEAAYRNAVTLSLPRLRKLRLRRQYADLLALEIDGGLQVAARITDVVRSGRSLQLEIELHRASSASSNV